MRVTQSMLTNSNLKYLSQNYNRLGKIQDQIMSGKKITKPSDDPVVAMKGMRYRSQVVEVEQFKRNLGEGFNWLENADASLDETGSVLQRIRELTVQASNDSYDPTARKNITAEISRLQEHIVALANTRVGDNYIFNGTNTASQPINENRFNLGYEKFQEGLSDSTLKAEDYVVSYKGLSYQYDSIEKVYKSANGDSISISGANGEIVRKYSEEQKYLDGQKMELREEINASDIVISNKFSVSTNTEDVRIEIMKGVTIPINVRPQGVYSTELFGSLESLKKMLNDPSTKGAELTKVLDNLDGFMNSIVSTRAELGAQMNRAEMVQDRLLQQEVIANKTVSDNEDIDFEKAIIDLTIQESLHRASLAAGARIIQPTLMDFLR
ncbi:flagellar hook-associated protein FlgL [Bacillus sp. 31A1R]|uniref:Flagellar hook-associated protein FlgL n=1 Tax=Robertmurraya mangrovi TaxID=3098077 RepID=A0ABU5IXS0_9BACI|nr:flagellar hook-associated protein FlgL [Bacillus sp. 31A1R]MDZ5471953.1 flagellar hook-associated protein FlgL [Bacillus sp. 31A1R]